MTTKQKRTLVLSSVLLLLALLIYGGYKRFLSPTKIAMVNFPTYQLTNFLIADDSPHTKVVRVLPEKASTLPTYDAIFVFGPGYRPTPEEIDAIAKAEKKGVPVYSFVFTSNTVKSHNITPEQQKQLDLYYDSRSRTNFKNMLLYTRKELDRGKWTGADPKPPIVIPSDVFYYLEEDTFYETAEQLTQHLREIGVYQEGAPNIAFLSGSTSPLEGNRAHLDSIITGFTQRGYNVYPIMSGPQRVKLLEQVQPCAVIYIPMGRLAGDEGVRFLTEHNVPIFCPLPITKSKEAWLADPHGAYGGFLTARIVLPEIDGALAPTVICTEEEVKENMFVFDPHPERLPYFLDQVTRYLDLRETPNRDKKVGIVFFRGAGQNSLVATGLEVVPSLYNFLKRLRDEGYQVDGLPATLEQFQQLIDEECAVWSAHSEGALQNFLTSAHPEWISVDTYRAWADSILVPTQYEEVVKHYGEAPGAYMAGVKDEKPAIAVARLKFGNVVVMPQPRAAIGGDDFKVVHGADVPPPHTYLAAYLWMQAGFQADALVHFGTHGSLEFTPGKQAALSKEDWADCLVGSVPHFYYYTISNVGEGIIAKRRLHAALVSYLTPPFKESKVRGAYQEVFDLIEKWRGASDQARPAIALSLKKQAVALDLHTDLQLDGDVTQPFSEEDIAYLENFLEEIANEKMTGKLYTLGEVYAPEDIHSSVMAMCADPIAYSLAKIDLLKGKIEKEQYESMTYVSGHYLTPVKQAIGQSLSGKAGGLLSALLRQSGITPEEMAQAKEMLTPKKRSQRPDRSNPSEGKGKPAGMAKAASGNQPADMPQPASMGKSAGGKMPAGMKAQPTEQGEEGTELLSKELATALVEIEKAVNGVKAYQEALESSPHSEMNALVGALSGAYIPPSPGGDAVRNPNTLPTGRNLFSINAEATPSVSAWNSGKALVEATLEQYVLKHGKYPRKVSYTFWAGEFIESEGATVAQALYMLGVEPIRDRMGRVTDLRLIPSEELGRPRIDIVVQTSGQLRDLAASRLILITKAIEMAAAAKDGEMDNFVSEGVVAAEKALIEKGLSPKEARDLSVVRVFGGLNGRYGTGIMDLVEKGDAWDDKSTIAETYLQNMGAIYGTEQNWGSYTKHLFEVALDRTDIVVQPRQNNTWGALSLDHMYEFMGGLNLTVENVTGKTPETYLADYRNRNRIRLQELKEAIGVESRTTLLNPEYIKEKMKGGASSANVFAKTFRNTYGWNVMKPDVIENSLWDRLYDVYVEDSYQLNVKTFFEKQNPAALQEMTAVMLETARKGMWQASEEQLKRLAELHTEIVDKYGASGSDFSDDNAKLQQFISEKVPTPQQAERYKQRIEEIKSVKDGGKSSIVLQQERVKGERENSFNAWWILAILGGFIILVFLLRVIKNRHEEE